MCNQLFHLVTGYGIARTLNRVHYIPNEKYLPHVQKYLNKFKEIFPLLHRSYTIAEDGINQTQVDFAGSCCAYDDPRRLANSSAKYLLLNFAYGQNPRYFEDYIGEVRNLLRFSPYVRGVGNLIIHGKKLQRGKMMCVHTRQTDFVAINVSTDASQTVVAADDIARRLGIERFMIFGDDQHFMHQLSLTIIDRGKLKKNAVVVSDFEEEIDFYLSSQLCRAFLLSAVTSTFGWWLAFFSPFQDAVYYVSDSRGQADKLPSKELFL